MNTKLQKDPKNSVYDPFTKKTTVYEITPENRLLRNGIVYYDQIERTGTLHAMTDTACLITSPEGSHIYDKTKNIYTFPMNNVIHVRYLYNIHKCVLTRADHAFVIVGPNEWNVASMDDLMLFSPSGSCVCFVDTHNFVLYESGCYIVLAETRDPYRIHAVTRIGETARSIYYNPDLYKIIINESIVLSMF